MAITNEFSVDGDVLFVKAAGVAENAADLDHNTATILQQMNHAGCSRVLVDDRQLQIHFDTMEIFKAAAANAATFRQMPAAKFAVILPLELQEDGRFYEDVAHNRGFKIQFFFDEPSARAWINE